MAERVPPPLPKPTVVLGAEIRALLAGPLDDVALRDQLDVLAAERAFAGFTWVWGPVLYRRNRVLFRPFLLNHFATSLVEYSTTFWPRRLTWRWIPIAWKGEAAESLDAWLAEVDRHDDVELFRRLYAWKHSARLGVLDEAAWRADLTQRYQATAARHERNTLLAKFDQRLSLDETAAVALYELDPVAAGPFILAHLPRVWYSEEANKRVLWKRLATAARQRGDDGFYFALYRKQVSLREWAQEVLQVADTIEDPGALAEALRQRHPEGWGLNLSQGLEQLLRRRGRDVLPYVLAHVTSVQRGWFLGGAYARLLALARERGWLDLWSTLVRTCATPPEYDQEVARLVGDHRLPEPEIERRLASLAGVGREWNFGGVGLARVVQLSDKTAVALYARFPTLLRVPFRKHISLGWANTYPQLLDRLLKAEDEPLIDYLASRVVGRFYGRSETGLIQAIARLTDYYRALLPRSTEFAQRAAAVLGQVPAYSIGNGYNEVIRTNGLARLFFARSSASYLEDAAAVRDLLEAPEIHVQKLALRALGLDDDRARLLARQNVDLLEATLLRPLHGGTRALAFRALANAATTPETARRVCARARQALDLPDKHYPKEQLIGLLGQLLHRWPELRRPWERPLVYVRGTP